MKRLKNIVYPLEHFRVPQGDRAPPFQKKLYTLLHLFLLFYVTIPVIVCFAQLSLGSHLPNNFKMGSWLWILIN